LSMARVAAVLPGYATVKHAGEVLHLAPRSVRDLIYTGRLPSVRIGRPHFVRVADLELERRRRLGLRLPTRLSRRGRPASQQPTGASSHPAVERHAGDPLLRRQRAAERQAMVSRWAERHASPDPGLPYMVRIASVTTSCTICSRKIRDGRRMVMALPDDEPLCLSCGRRALLGWADRRRLEAAAARRLAHDLAAAAAVAEVPDASQVRRVA
jgi:hypothetical protein